MAEKIVDVKLKTASDTQANWKSKNTTLLDGELAYDKTKKNLKIGDGITAWNNLPYLIPEVEIAIEIYSAQVNSNNATMPVTPTPTNEAYFSDKDGNMITSNFSFPGQDSNGEWKYVYIATKGLEISANEVQIGLILGEEPLYFRKTSETTGYLSDGVGSTNMTFTLVESENVSNYYTKDETYTKEEIESLVAGSSSEVNLTPIEFLQADAITGWYDHFDCYNLEISNEKYQEFLQRKFAPIKINNIPFEVYSFEEYENGDYSVYYSCVVNNYVNRLCIIWRANDSFVDDCEGSAIDESALIEPIKIEGTISGWETEDFILSDVLFEPTDYQKFLQNKTAPIMIEDKVFQLVQFYFDEEAQGYYNTYTHITNNYIYKIVIGWFDDEPWVDEAYNNKISVSIIELSADSTQLNGTLSWEQYTLYNSKAKEQVAFKVYNDDYGYTFYLTYSHATDDGGFVYACTTADEVHTLTLYDDQYSYYFSTINNEYVESGSSGETSEIPTIMIRDFLSYENVDGTLESCDFEGIKKAKMCFVNPEELEEGNGMIFQVISINSADSINLGSVVTYDDGITVSYYIYLYKNGDEVTFDCYRNTSDKVIYDSSSTNYYGVEIFDDRIQLDLWAENRYYNLDLAEILGSLEYDNSLPLYITFQRKTKAFIYAGEDINIGSIRFIAPNKIFETLIYHGLEVNAKGSFPNDESFVEYIHEYGDDFSSMAFHVEVDEIGICKICSAAANHEV